MGVILCSQSTFDIAYIAIIIHVCCEYMFQMSYLNVAFVAMPINICCTIIFPMFHIFLTYIISVLSECYSNYTQVDTISFQCFR
jgi:hypothetical protein